MQGDIHTALPTVHMPQPKGSVLPPWWETSRKNVYSHELPSPPQTGHRTLSGTESLSLGSFAPLLQDFLGHFPPLLVAPVWAKLQMHMCEESPLCVLWQCLLRSTHMPTYSACKQVFGKSLEQTWPYGDQPVRQHLLALPWMPLCPFCREAEAPYLMAAVRRCRGSAGIPGLDGDLRDLTRVRCGCLSELSRPINGERSRRAANILRRGCALAVVPWT